MGNLAERVDWQRRKEGNRVDTESGQRKAPQGKPYGAGKEGMADLLAVASEGGENHKEHEESAQQQVP